MPLLKHILYEKGAVNPGPPSEWECQLLEANGHILKLEGLEDLDKPEIVEDFISGVSRITIPGGAFDETSIYIPPNAEIVVDNSEAGNLDTNATPSDNIFLDHMRRLLQGNKKVIVIRIVDSRNIGPSSSVSQISDSVFGPNDPHNLVTRYNDCSFGKLKFEPLRQLNQGDPRLDALGAYEVKVPVSAENVFNTVVREAVTDQLNLEWPGTNLPEYSDQRLDASAPFDYAMYCMPPGTKGNWIAYAFSNSWLSVYNGTC